LPVASAKYTRQGGEGAIGNRRLLLPLELLLDAWLVTTATYGGSISTSVLQRSAAC